MENIEFYQTVWNLAHWGLVMEENSRHNEHKSSINSVSNLIDCILLKHRVPGHLLNMHTLLLFELLNIQYSVILASCKL